MYGHVYMQLRPPQIVNACAVLPLSFTVTFASLHRATGSWRYTRAGRLKPSISCRTDSMKVEGRGIQASLDHPPLGIRGFGITRFYAQHPEPIE
jgi:hypothetical protein